MSHSIKAFLRRFGICAAVPLLLAGCADPYPDPYYPYSDGYYAPRSQVSTGVMIQSGSYYNSPPRGSGWGRPGYYNGHRPPPGGWGPPDRDHPRPGAGHNPGPNNGQGGGRPPNGGGPGRPDQAGGGSGRPAPSLQQRQPRTEIKTERGQLIGGQTRTPERQQPDRPTGRLIIPDDQQTQ